MPRMKVLLTEDVKNLGKTGDVVEVRTGYGLNFLFPKGWAVLATPQALRGRERMLAEASAAESAKQAERQAIQARIDGQSFTIKSQAKDGKLFGSVGKKEIAQALEIESRFVELTQPLREVGSFPVEIDFGGGVTAQVTVVLAAE